MSMSLGFGFDFGSAGDSAFDWLNSTAYADLAMVADFNLGRYALPAYGPELVTDGDFSSGTTSGWVDALGSYNVILSNPDSLLRITANGSGGGWIGAYKEFSGLKIGELYQVSGDLTAVSGFTLGNGSLYVYSAGGVSVIQGFTSITTPSSKTFYFVAQSTSVRVRFRVEGTFTSGVSYAEFDNVSLREVILTRDGAALGANLAASEFALSADAGSATATESPLGTLNLTGDGANIATADKSFPTIVGRRYRGMFNVATNVPSSFRIGTAQGGSQTVPATAVNLGFNSFEFTATDTTHWLRLQKSSALTSVISSIEIRELPATGAFPKRSATFDEFFAFAASSTTARTYVAADGTYKNDLAANAPRFDWRNGKRQLRLEDAETNFIRNNSMIGASAGAPGTLPTNWSVGGGIVPSVVGSGTEFGLPYVDLRFSGTTGATYTDLRFDAPNGVASGNGISWAMSAFVRMVGGSNANILGTVLAINLQDAGSAYLSTQIFSSQLPTYSFLRYSGTAITANASVAYVRPQLTVNHPNGVPVDVTYRVYAPQLELGSFASDPILTTGSAVTRAIETAEFSPLVEAIMQRAAGSAVARAKMDYWNAGVPGGVSRIIGGGAGNSILGTSTTGVDRINAYNGTGSITTGSNPSTPVTGPFGSSTGFDSGGRSIAIGSQVASDSNPVGDRSALYLGRPSVVTTNPSYAPGNYDFVGFAPERLSNATLQTLAVPA